MRLFPLPPPCFFLLAACVLAPVSPACSATKNEVKSLASASEIPGYFQKLTLEQWVAEVRKNNEVLISGERSGFYYCVLRLPKAQVAVLSYRIRPDSGDRDIKTRVLIGDDDNPASLWPVAMYSTVTQFHLRDQNRKVSAPLRWGEVYELPKSGPAQANIVVVIRDGPYLSQRITVVDILVHR
ncbi:MAG: hypothetical protein SFY92_10430 [Verrucomicrobiae bacterium]|nr:hypothetical protein [Verrucomicrobiae bacterium]